MSKAYWLLKTEPDAFSLDDLKAQGKAGEPWNGIRNYQARNFLRAMKAGDQCLIYHSACKVPAAVGIAEVIKAAYPDPDALNPEAHYYDPKSSADNNRWSVVDVRYRETLANPVTLKHIKATAELADMALVKSSRLSVSPVTEAQFECILRLSQTPE